METTSGDVIYYKFECDDNNRPSGMLPDIHFALSEYDKAIALKNAFDADAIKYTFLLEKFNQSNDEIISRDYFVDNNCLNQ